MKKYTDPGGSYSKTLGRMALHNDAVNQDNVNFLPRPKIACPLLWLKHNLSLSYKQIYGSLFTFQSQETFSLTIARCAEVHIHRQNSLSQTPPAICCCSAQQLPHHKPHSLLTTQY